MLPRWSSLTFFNSSRLGAFPICPNSLPQAESQLSPIICLTLWINKRNNDTTYSSIHAFSQTQLLMRILIQRYSVYTPEYLLNTGDVWGHLTPETWFLPFISSNCRATFYPMTYFKWWFVTYFKMDWGKQTGINRACFFKPSVYHINIPFRLVGIAMHGGFLISPRFFSPTTFTEMVILSHHYFISEIRICLIVLQECRELHWQIYTWDLCKGQM